jgi:hypothetical protein
MNGPELSIRQGRLPRSGTRVTPISQVSMRLLVADAEAAFGEVRNDVLNWIAERAGRPLPPEAWRGQTFELQDVGSQRTGAAVLDKPRYWAGRVDDADREVPQRTWSTEFGIAIASPTEVRFGCRLQCVSLGDFSTLTPSIPRVVRNIARRFAAESDGRLVVERAWLIEGQDECRDLAKLMFDRDRRHSVIVISQRGADGLEIGGDAKAIADRLAVRTAGFAHVVLLGEEVGYTLTDYLGKEFSVFNGAVRSYRAGFQPETDEPARHPLALLSSISAWPDGGVDGFCDFLVRQAFRQSVSGRNLEMELPAFTSIRRMSVERRRLSAKERGDSDAQMLTLAMEENDSLRRQIDDDKRTSDGLLEAAENERDHALDELDDVRNENRGLRDRIEYLLGALHAKGRNEEVEIPESFEDLEEWAARYLSGAVHVANRAIRAARKSEYADPQLAYRALLVLRDFYVRMRKGDADKAEYDTALAELGLEDSATFGGTRAAQFGDEYFVMFAGKKRELDRHLKGSNSRDERFGFRLYFFWDEQSRQVVVGWLPNHLSTDAS